MKTFSMLYYLVAAFSLLTAGQAFAQSGFVLSSTNTAGLLPAHIAVADFNNDGKPDILVTDAGNSVVLAFTNSGQGFVASGSYPVGGAPLGITAADINHDGYIDFITANTSGESLTIYTNDGHGNFSLNQTCRENATGFPSSVAVADLNGDGFPDLVCNQYNSGNTLIILTNNGSGIFSNAVTLTVDQEPSFVTVADINGDGKPDLISANEGLGSPWNNTVTILTNNGNYVYGTNATYTVGTAPTWVTVADVNMDGKPDLISANYNYGNSLGTLTVLTNNGSGGFGSNATYVVGSQPATVIAADINGDGLPDLISVNAGVSPSYAGTVTVLTNAGGGKFVIAETLNTGRYPLCIAAADLNGDGRLDLVAPNYMDHSVYIFTNTGTFLPLLSTRKSGGSCVVSWPSQWSGWAGWNVQQTTNLAGNIWNNFTGTLTSDGQNEFLTNSLSGGNKFFRLFHP